jgi:hypothetical protein
MYNYRYACINFEIYYFTREHQLIYFHEWRSLHLVSTQWNIFRSYMQNKQIWGYKCGINLLSCYSFQKSSLFAIYMNYSLHI